MRRDRFIEHDIYIYIYIKSIHSDSVRCCRGSSTAFLSLPNLLTLFLRYPYKTMNGAMAFMCFDAYISTAYTDVVSNVCVQ